MAGSATAADPGEHFRGGRGRRRAIITGAGAASATRRRAGAERLPPGGVGTDLKPENIFLVEDPENPGGERVKILDFGIAKFLNGDPGKQTSTGMVLGTPKYISPEQCDGRDHLSGKSDVYSLGVKRNEGDRGVRARRSPSRAAAEVRGPWTQWWEDRAPQSRKDLMARLTSSGALMCARWPWALIRR